MVEVSEIGDKGSSGARAWPWRWGRWGHWGRTGLPWLVLAAGVAGSAWLSHAVRVQEIAGARARLEANARDNVAALQNAMQQALEPLQAMAWFLEASPSADEAAFASFASALRRRAASLQAMGQVHAEPVDPSNGPRWTVRTVSPPSEAAGLAGLDLGRSEALKALLMDAASRSEVVLGGFTRLPGTAQRPEGRLAILAAVAVREGREDTGDPAPKAKTGPVDDPLPERPADKGPLDPLDPRVKPNIAANSTPATPVKLWVVGALRLTQVLDRVMANATGMNLRLYDYTDMDKGDSDLLYVYAHRGGEGERPSKPDADSDAKPAVLETHLSLRVAGRRWRAAYAIADPIQLGSSQANRALLAGLVVTLLLTSYMAALSNRTTYAENLAGERTQELSATLVELHNSEAQYRQLADNIEGEVFWITDAQGSAVHYLSPGYDAVYGQSRQAIQERPERWFDAVHPADREALRKRFFQDAREGRLDAEYRIVRPDGGVRWIWDKGFPVRDEAGNVLRLVGIAEDVTARKEAEMALREAKADMESKNAELQQFVYTVSHDLKSPIVTTLGFIDILKDDVASDPPDRQAVLDSAGRIERAAKRMKELIDSLLQLSRIGRMKQAPEDLDMGALIEDIRGEMEFRLEGVVLEVEPDLPPIFADKVRITELFENLIGNALKYGCSGPTPRIVVGARRGDGHVKYFVRDFGQGIAPEHHHRIFELFQRVNEDKSVEGTGVGLAIVKRIMEVHGGRVWVESTPGQGATFWLSFPVLSVGG